MRASFKLAASGSTVLPAITEKKEGWYEHFACFSLPQSPLPVEGNGKCSDFQWWKME